MGSAGVFVDRTVVVDGQFEADGEVFDGPAVDGLSTIEDVQADPDTRKES